MGQLQVAATRAEVSQTSNQLQIANLAASITPASTNQLQIARTQADVVPTVPANAGSNLNDVEPLTTVTLDASATGALTYSWALFSATGGETVTITNPTSAIATYRAPANMAGTTLVFRVTANGSDTADVTHVILPHLTWRYDGTAWKPIRRTV